VLGYISILLYCIRGLATSEASSDIRIMVLDTDHMVTVTTAITVGGFSDYGGGYGDCGGGYGDIDIGIDSDY
jgi:hypothetical protein